MPLIVSPTNPRYFQDAHGDAILLAGSHNWQNLQDLTVLGDFDWAGYLALLVAHGHNFMRLWAREPLMIGTPCPPARYPRTGGGVANDGGQKYDLSQFDPVYFTRLRARVDEAWTYGIYVGVMLWSGWAYRDNGDGNPFPNNYFHSANNIGDGVTNPIDGNYLADDAYGDECFITTADAMSVSILALQRAYVEHVVDTLSTCPNVIWELSHEMQYSSRAWQEAMITYLRAYETGLGIVHPIGYSAFLPHSTESNGWLVSSSAEWISPGNVSGGETYIDPPVNDGTKVNILNTNHIYGDPGGGLTWVWRAFLRGYNPTCIDDLSENFEQPSQRDALQDVLVYSRKLTMANVVPTSDTDACSTGYLLQWPGYEYLAFQPTGGAAFTLTMLEGYYAWEWFNVDSRTIVDSGTDAFEAGVNTFTPPSASRFALLLTRVINTVPYASASLSWTYVHGTGDLPTTYRFYGGTQPGILSFIRYVDYGVNTVSLQSLVAGPGLYFFDIYAHNVGSGEFASAPELAVLATGDTPMATGQTLAKFFPLENDPPSANGATLDFRNYHPVLDFDDTTDESAVFTDIMPRNYAGGGVVVYLHWAATSDTNAAHKCRWDVAFERIASQDMDADSFAAVQSATGNPNATSGIETVTSIAFTDGAQMDSVGVGEPYRLKVTRDANHATDDDMTGDAELIAVEIKEV